MKPYTIILSVLFFMMTMGCLSCRKYLDEKPDASKVLPKTLGDCQLLLDEYFKMNANYPSEGEAAADNYYITDINYGSMTNQDAKNNYIWHPEGQHITHWNNPYTVVYNANLILHVLTDLPPTGAEYERIKGSALFFRGFAFYHIAQLFTKPYNAATAQTDPGIPLRLSPDADTKIGRGSLQQTYDRIIQDLKDAVTLLPVSSTIQTRPNKVAAYAALARVYLAIEDYTKAGEMANEALALHNTLMDYKTISSITRFNPETIFHAITLPNALLSSSIAKMDTLLYNFYEADDRRKTIFFRPNTGANSGTYSFRGSYDGSPGSNVFTGLATDELYLVRAEVYARTDNTALAMEDLNTLLRNRYDASFVDRTAANAGEALLMILEERRKELVFRNHRWTDLRRLNKDPQFAVTLSRYRNTIAHTPLTPGDLRYAMLLPFAEIGLLDISQNPR